jgi:hypothetical protein
MIISNMKSILKIVFIGIVIVGLVASYVFVGLPTPTPNTSADFEGPTEAPNQQGPSEQPPGQ